MLLATLTTSCNLEQIAAPPQHRTTPAQAAEQTPAAIPEPAAVKARDKIETPADTPAEPPEPSQVIPQLMSQASSTANSELFPASTSGTNQGPLRIGNQTEHPLRIAFLAQGETPTDVEPSPEAAIAANSPEINSPATNSQDTESPETASPDSQTIRAPFHWDFAPDEGGRDGLLLALPEGDLALQDGDVIVAFAQDGSQRYWGPYVVGKTSLPHWNGDRSEWQLLVQP